MSASSFTRRLGKRLVRLLRRGTAARGGAAAVEFAVMSPFLLALLVPLADLGAYIYDNMQLQLAAQAGAEYAARHQWNPTGIQAAIIAAAPSLNLSLTDNSVPNANDVLPSPFTPANVTFCGCAAGTTITQVACTNPRPICQATGLTSGVYLTVGAQWQYTTLTGFNYPFLPQKKLIQATSTVRIQ